MNDDEKAILATILKRDEEMRRTHWGLLSMEWIETVLLGPPWSELPEPLIPEWVTRDK